jgi:hypothetical protein
MRVNPEGTGVTLCKWPTSITAITNKMKVTNRSREDTERQEDASEVAIRVLAVSVPRTKGSQIRMSHEPKEIGQFGNVQLAVSIPIGHLKFSFEKAQQLSLAYCALVGTSGGLSHVVGHG